jgi:ATP-dependent helicase HrpB
MDSRLSTTPLPIDPFVPDILDAVRRSRAVVVTAQPGAGKTTRVPPALVDDGPVILLQPRRVAARAIAQRIAGERGWTIGNEIGWQIRFERRFGARTRLLVATEGVLTARFQQDPLLSGFRTIVLDEFHERSVHADLAIALAKQAWRARDDLRIVVMSATLDAAAVVAFLDVCPVVDVPGRLYPVSIAYAAGQSVADAAVDVVNTTAGHVLCFLPGAPEIRRTIADLQSRAATRDVDILPLHGSLDPAAQDAALRPSRSGTRRIVVATNIAETSVTVPGVTAVIDSGQHKVARYDADRAIDSLELERITEDAADQRAGRAGRESPGVVRRLWDARDRLRPHREPEIHRVDLSAVVLDVIAWGGDPRQLEWFERPGEDAIDAAVTLLERLGAVQHGKLTGIGEQIQRIPLHPRLARMLVAADGARAMAQACALLSERHFIAARTHTTTSDLLSAVDDWRTVPLHVQRVAREIESLAGSGFRLRVKPRRTAVALAEAVSRTSRARFDESDFRRAVLAGYPDRVAQRRGPGWPRVRLASGAGAVIASESGVRDGEFLVALDVQALHHGGHRGHGGSPGGEFDDARVRLASRVERQWLHPTGSDLVHRFDPAAGAVKAFFIERYDALVLAERPTAPDPEIAAPLLANAWLERGPAEGDRQLLRRLRFVGHAIDVEHAIRSAARHATSVGDLQLARVLPAEVLRALDRDAPETIAVPSGRTVRLEYGEDGSVSASVKLQELFGLGETPRIGPRREPVRLALLAPNGRPVQVTRDLRSFWDRTYPDVRKELRGRYPKHPWPEDPWKATPTARATKGRRHGGR